MVPKISPRPTGRQANPSLPSGPSSAPGSAPEGGPMGRRPKRRIPSLLQMVRWAHHPELVEGGRIACLPCTILGSGPAGRQGGI